MNFSELEDYYMAHSTQYLQEREGSSSGQKCPAVVTKASALPEGALELGDSCRVALPVATAPDSPTGCSVTASAWAVPGEGLISASPATNPLNSMGNECFSLKGMIKVAFHSIYHNSELKWLTKHV